VQSWRGQKSLADAARSGYQGILSNGYYLDYMWPAGRHYLVDPLGKEAADLPDEAKARILGGEACMWAEWVSPETIDSRIWPRAAAIAERYWSPAGTTDVADMYRRLAVVSRHLDFTGIRHRTAYVPMLERMADARPADALQGIVDLLEPVREYNRGRGLNQGSLTPLTRVIDAARPESEEARRFSLMVDGLLADPGRKANREAIVQALQGWKDDATEVQPLLDTFLLQEAVPLVTRASDVAAVGLRAMQALDQGTPLQLTPRESLVLAEAGKPLAEVLLMIVPAVQRLVGAAAEK
jgi:hexosaminidase